MEDAKNLVKKSAVIAVTGKLSEQGRKVYNALLYHALPNMLTTEIHKISVQYLLSEIKGLAKSNNYEHVKKILSDIMGTSITHDTLKVDMTGEWFHASLISYFSIKEGVLQWEYPSPIRHLLATGKLKIGDGESAKEITIPYAIIDKTQFFESRYAGALYELSLHWLPQKKNQGESPWKSLTELQILFGGKEGSLSYSKYYDLNRFVIKKATQEINKKESLPFTVSTKTKKLGRSVAFIKFEIKRKKKVETSNEIDIENPREFIKALLTINGLHAKTITKIIKTADKKNALIELAEKAHEVCERYAKKSPVKEKIKAITGGLNKHLESLAQMELPFDQPEKATPREINKQAIRDCINSKPFCEIRRTKQARIELCYDCLDFFPLEAEE